jgi:TetR/AcrR family transcriptional repressor of nem operon
MRQRLQAAPFNQEEEALDRVFGRVDFLIALMRGPQAPRACLLGTFIQELSATQPGIRQVCASCLAEGARAFQEDLDAARAKHAPDAPWTGQGLAEHFTAVTQGAIIVAKARQDPTAVADSLAHFREYLRLLFGR